MSENEEPTPTPAMLLALADRRVLGRKGDNEDEALLRSCAQQWVFDQSESANRKAGWTESQRRLASALSCVETRGCRRLVDGQVDDDLHEVEVCRAPEET